MQQLRYGLFAALTLAFLAPAVAQQDAPAPQVAETPHCGGLLCDLGVFGRKPAPGEPSTTLPCHDFLCRAFGGNREVEAAPPPPAAPVAELVVDKPVRHARKKTHAAKTTAAAEQPKAADAK